jgi:uncharacterized membrane protein
LEIGGCPPANDIHSLQNKNLTPLGPGGADSAFAKSKASCLAKTAGQVNLSLRNKWMKIAFEENIRKPAEIVFSWIADPEKAMKWQKNVKSEEIIYNKPEIIGTTFKEIVEEDGKRLEMYGMITKYTRNKTIGFHLKSKIHEFDVSYSVEQIDEETKVSIAAIIKWKFPMNFIGLFIGKRMEEGIMRQVKSEILDLKRVCEGE